MNYGTWCSTLFHFIPSPRFFKFHTNKMIFSLHFVFSSTFLASVRAAADQTFTFCHINFSCHFNFFRQLLLLLTYLLRHSPEVEPSRIWNMPQCSMVWPNLSKTPTVQLQAYVTYSSNCSKRAACLILFLNILSYLNESKMEVKSKPPNVSKNGPIGSHPPI